ncbi:TonB-dependent receptor plug domain-containing protein [Chitinophaga niabensis]|uniref:Hemoglobin/transferrin/lactoferrin receptor protein n=1 Tax=Chitinophaga niabensis TaxID=536979 RepID=A0A1N6F4H5_9BACT|nr:TonB-dependent receptor [Chitinophaga niabensis]SIN90198.1 hemoglobin/transferrin/lactoferrin receptor protein [Chitinophaga niabensis]
MKIILSFVITVTITGTALAQQKDTLAEVIVTANKFEEKRKYVAAKVEVLQLKDIDQSLSNNTGGLLEQSGKVFVQRSQAGGGSPVLRGFEASRILLVVDGVRMNNAIYRTGHLQNVITIDDDILDKVEIIYGPASTIYGSDALGGIIHFQTRKPLLAAFATTLSTRYSSAYEEYTGHVDVNAGGRKFASLTSISYSNFGDLRQGSNRNPLYGDFGKRKSYIQSIQGIDSIVKNKDENIQRQSAYKQYDILQKFLWQPAQNHSHELNIQYSTSSDIPRYDRLTDLRNGQLRWAEWYYGPQERLMAAYQYKAKALKGFFDQLMAGVNYQKIQESRMQRAYRNDEREHRVEDIQVIALNADLRRSMGRNELNVGIDGQFNILQSTAYRQNVRTSAKRYGLDTRYPDGSNNMHYSGIYAQHLFKIIPGKLILNDGLRVNYVSLQSEFKDTALLHLPFTSASQRNITFSANAGIIYLPDDKSKFSFSISTGFRAPNIDDMAKVFESAGGTQLVVPNPDLKPEQTFNFDLGINRRFSDWIYVEANAFYSLFRNAIITDRFSLNGATEVAYNGQMTPVVASQNKARADIYGFQAGINLRPVEAFDFYSQLTYTYGRYRGRDDVKVPMDHIPPVFGKTGISYRYRFLGLEAYALYNSWKRAKDYSPSGEDNLQYAMAEGMPAWCTLHLSSTWKISSFLKVQAALENLLDQNYRVFSSGISSAGRNLVLKLKAEF